MAEQLGRCEDFDSPHEYSGMTCKNWQPEAAPAPQAEGACTKCGHPKSDHFSCEVGSYCKGCDPNQANPWFWEHVFVGAAPAETARPQLVGEYSVGNVRVIIRHLGRPEIHECTACGVTLPGPEMWDHVKTHIGETAGEMTAKQFYEKWHSRKFAQPDINPTVYQWLEFADAHAKQRVEQALADKVENSGSIVGRRIKHYRAKVADLERERDDALNRHVQFMVQGGPVVMSADFDKMKTRAEAAESELREMREALQVTAIFAPHNHQFAGDDTKGCPKCDAERLLARKAGS